MTKVKLLILTLSTLDDSGTDMINLVECIATKNFDEANSIVEEKFDLIMRSKLLEMKKMVSAKSNYKIRSGDMTGKTCTKCHKGKYQETTQHDDMDGILHCTSCNSTIRRWKYIKEELEEQNLSMHKRYPNEASKVRADIKEEDLEEEQLDEARFKIVKARIRNGKIQRRKKVSNVPGMTFRGGKLTRMTPQERRRRKMGARRGKIKRKAKMSRALMKRKRSMMKRRSMGLR